MCNRNCYGKVFESSSGQGYVYLTSTNEILTINQVWFESLAPEIREKEILSKLGAANVQYSEMADRMQWMCEGQKIRHAIDKQLTSITLEITQQCSLRCDYCIYSGNYKGYRTHREFHMPWNIIKKSIDYFAVHNEEYPTADISFYGGEALLCFDSICKAIKYAREKIANKPLHFHISSNGTTLTPQIQKWLSENEDVDVTITLNGWSHNRYRKFPSGKGSLDCIMTNLQEIRKNYPRVWERIDFIANVSSLREVWNLSKYYREYIGKPPMIIGSIVKIDGNDVIKEITKKDFEDELYRQKIYGEYVENYDSYLKPFCQVDIEEICVRPIGLQSKILTAPCCVPFAENFFVAADGTLAFCEKVNAIEEYGTIQTGLKFDKVEQAIEEALEAYNSKCKTCWACRLCDVCFQHMLRDKSGKLYIPDEACEDVKSNLLQNLSLFCDIKESNPSLLEKIRADYAESYRTNHPEANQL